MKKSTKILIIILLFIIIIGPLAMMKNAEFGGADGEAEGVISDIDPNYQPWFSSILEPASGEIESLLFAFQAALGASVIAYYFGYKKGLKKNASD
ncbi:MAG: energy-coupling factor ABC transporter substrate-binding protein [Eubacteriaceae bacterium]|nr:energy-coupling factor ABC transporter substrate-binding protein [Eubacteriaceae bacterium]